LIQRKEVLSFQKILYSQFNPLLLGLNYHFITYTNLSTRVCFTDTLAPWTIPIGVVEESS